MWKQIDYLVATDKIKMEHWKAADKPNWDKCVYDQCNWGRSLEHCSPDVRMLSIHDLLNVHPAESENINTE